MNESIIYIYILYILYTFRKLRLECQSAMRKGYRWSSLSLAVWAPALRSLAPAKRTRVSWSPKHGTLMLANASQASGSGGTWAAGWSGLEGASTSGPWGASWAGRAHRPALERISCNHVSSWSSTSTTSAYFFSSFISTGNGMTSDRVLISSLYCTGKSGGTRSLKNLNAGSAHNILASRIL